MGSSIYITGETYLSKLVQFDVGFQFAEANFWLQMDRKCH